LEFYFIFIDLIFFKSFFQSTPSNNIERFHIKLSPKAKEAFEQINRTAQSRLEGDQTKVNFIENLIFSIEISSLLRLKMHNVVHSLQLILCPMKKNFDDVEKDKFV